MKTKKIIMTLVVAAITTGLFAQPQVKSLTPEQKVEIQKVHDAYSPKMTELKQEMKTLATEQKVLLSSKVIDDKQVFANIDKMGTLKASMQKEMLAMCKEKSAIAPDVFGKHKNGMRGQRAGAGNGQGLGQGSRQGRGNGQGLGQGSRQGQGNGQGLAQGSRQGKGNGQGQMNAQRGQNRGQGQPCLADGNKKMGPKGKQGNSPRQGMKNGSQPRQPMANRMDYTDEQKEAIKAVRAAHFWDIQETQNAIALLKAKNVTVDDKIMNLDKLSALQTQLSKQKMTMKLETIGLMTEEQRMKAIAMHNSPKKHAKKGMHKRF